MSFRLSDKSYKIAMDSSEKLGGLLRQLVSGIPWSECAESEQRLELDVPSKGIIHIHNANGRTSVVGESRENVEIVASKQARAECMVSASEMVEKMKIKSECLSGALEIEVDIPRKWNRHGRIDLMIRIPDHLQLEVASANGKVHVCGMRSDVRARSSNGSVGIENVVGDMNLSTANAKVSCADTCGRLTARSSNGMVEMRDHTGSIDASTSNGSITASLVKLADDGIMLATSNGRIVLDLPTAVDAQVDIRVDNGVIRNSRSDEPGLIETAGRVRGKLGRGGPIIKLRTSNGTVAIH